MDSLTTKRFLLIHRAIHDPKTTAVIIAHERIPIRISRNKCKYITWNEQTFIQQDPSHTTKYAQLTQDGIPVTWVMRTQRKRWGLIVNNKIKRE